MGQSESSDGGGGDASGRGDDVGGIIGRLPEECISHAIALTSPRDACRSAAVSTTFRSASASDVVWRRFLPSDYEAILARAVAPVNYSSQRELFFRLSDHPILINDGNISFALDKHTGAKCFMLAARKLTIVWGDTPDHWRWIKLPNSSNLHQTNLEGEEQKVPFNEVRAMVQQMHLSSFWPMSPPPPLPPELFPSQMPVSQHKLTSSRFAEVAELLDVCWMEISGKIESKMLSPGTNYAAYLVYGLSNDTYGLHYPSQEASVKLGANFSKSLIRLGPPEWYEQLMDPAGGNIAGESVDAGIRKTQARRTDGWMEMELGEFYNEDGEDGMVDISLMEVRGGHWKKGLIIQGIDIRPKL